jgi:hypothetical protein
VKELELLILGLRLEFQAVILVRALEPTAILFIAPHGLASFVLELLPAVFPKLVSCQILEV